MWVMRDPEVSDGFKFPWCSVSQPSNLLPLADLDTGGVGDMDVCFLCILSSLPMLKSHEFLTFSTSHEILDGISTRCFLCWVLVQAQAQAT